MDAHQRLAYLVGRKVVFNILTIVTVMLVDHFSKTAVLSMLNSRSEIEFAPFFSIVEVWNKGVAFGLFSKKELHPIILVTVQLAAVGFIYFTLMLSNDLIVCIPISMIMGGALGNIQDRMRNGAVFDFLDFHIGKYHFPPFNIADMCIVGGFLWISLVMWGNYRS